MNAKHTPGPFEAINNLVRSSITPPEGVPKGILIAECNDSYGLPHSSESMANAKLFAAAPELLAALKDCQDALRIYAPDVLALEQANKAIEKAEGGAA